VVVVDTLQAVDTLVVGATREADILAAAVTAEDIPVVVGMEADIREVEAVREADIRAAVAIAGLLRDLGKATAIGLGAAPTLDGPVGPDMRDPAAEVYVARILRTADRSDMAQKIT